QDRIYSSAQVYRKQSVACGTKRVGELRILKCQIGASVRFSKTASETPYEYSLLAPVKRNYLSRAWSSLRLMATRPDIRSSTTSKLLMTTVCDTERYLNVSSDFSLIFLRVSTGKN